MGVIPLDDPPGRGVVPGGRQSHSDIFLEIEDRLHQALPPGPTPDNYGTALILEGAGDDLRGRSTAPIDEDHQGKLLPGVALLGFVASVHRFLSPLDGDDKLAFLKEPIRQGHRLAQVSPLVVPEVENESLERVPGELLHGLVELLDGDAREASYHNQAQLLLGERNTEAVGDRVERDLLPFEGEVDRRLQTLPDHGETNDTPLGTPELAEKFLLWNALGGLPIHLDNHVSRLDSHPERRSPLQGGDDCQTLLNLQDLDADPVELPLLILLHGLKRIGIQEVRVRVQGREHASKCRVSHGLVCPLAPESVLFEKRRGLGVLNDPQRPGRGGGGEKEEGKQEESEDSQTLHGSILSHLPTEHSALTGIPP